MAKIPAWMTLLLLTLVGTTPVSAESAEPTSIGQAIVGFHPDAYLETDFLAGLPVLETEPRGHYLVVAAETLDEVRQALAGMPGVLYIEDNQLLHAAVVPNDARYNEQYGPAMMGAETAWQHGYGSSSVTVAVLDTGIRASHEDLVGGRMLQGYDYVNNDNNPADDCDHGTHVIGTVAATTNNGKGVAGMSQATILPMKVLGPVGGLFSVTCSGSQSDINQAIYDATDQGAHIISMSLGGGGYSSSGDAAVNYAWNRDVLVVAAAGNDGNSNSVDYPAAYANSIAVAALTSSKTRASYSDMGSQVEIAAPGSDVLSTVDDSNSAYKTMSGTSMATPHVAGALAFAKGCAPSASAQTIRNQMAATAEDLGSAGRDTSYGFGLLRVDALVAALGCSGAPSNNAPTASFTDSVSGLSVSFDGTASSDPDNDPLSYAWTFGDGNSGSGVSPSHTYAAGGTYTVQLTVSDGKGGSDSTSKQVTVTAPGGGNDPDPSTPNLQNGVTQAVSVSSGGEAHWKIEVPAGATTLTVQMDGPSCGVFGCSFDADLYVRLGSRATDSSYDCRPYQSGSDESCTISNPSGWYYVRVDAYSGSGTVDITATHDAPTGPTNGAPTASFTHSENGLTTNLDGSASSDPDGDALTYTWDFGDGNSGSGVSPSHTYSSAGTYTVQLTVDDGNGGSDTAAASVTVTAPNGAPTASFTHSASALTASFDASASSDPDGDALTYTWDFGDGNTGSGVAPSHTYAAAGTYTVQLTVDDGNGATDTTSASVTATNPNDPDPSTPNLQNGATQSVSVSSGGDAHYKIYVPAGSTLSVSMTGPSCGLFGCSFDADLYVREGARATDSSYDCRPYQSGSNESCSVASNGGWFYVRVDAYSGSGTVDVTASF